MKSLTPRVAIVMGSQSDWPTMQFASEPLNALGIEFVSQVVSAHRTPERLYQFAQTAENEGFSAIIAGAGGSAHLPGMLAAMTIVPVVAVPVRSQALNGIDSLLSIVQMPKGVAVATQAIGEPGAFNAGLITAQMIAISDANVRERLREWREQQTEGVPREVE